MGFLSAMSVKVQLCLAGPELNQKAEKCLWAVCGLTPGVRRDWDPFWNAPNAVKLTSGCGVWWWRAGLCTAEQAGRCTWAEPGHPQHWQCWESALQGFGMLRVAVCNCLWQCERPMRWARYSNTCFFSFRATSRIWKKIRYALCGSGPKK